MEKTISEVGREFSTQRALAKDDIEHLIRYAAADQFGAALPFGRLGGSLLHVEDLLPA